MYLRHQLFFPGMTGEVNEGSFIVARQFFPPFYCAFCIYELNGHLSPLQVTAGFVYLRLHGPRAKYQGSYSDEALQKWTGQCKSWLKTKDVYVYFDNDEKGYAAFNAITLKN